MEYHHFWDSEEEIERRRNSDPHYPRLVPCSLPIHGEWTSGPSGRLSDHEQRASTGKPRPDTPKKSHVSIARITTGNENEDNVRESEGEERKHSDGEAQGTSSENERECVGRERRRDSRLGRRTDEESP